MHVDELLDQLTPDEFEERWAANELDPINDSWRQTGTVCATIANQLEQVLAILQKRQPHYFKTTDFIPRLPSQTQAPRVRRPQPDDLEARAAKRYVSHR